MARFWTVKEVMTLAFDKYDPELHDNHKQPFTEDDLIYMCSVWEFTKKEDIALALGKTHGSIVQKGVRLRKQGRFEHYKKLGSF